MRRRTLHLRRWHERCLLDANLPRAISFFPRIIGNINACQAVADVVRTTLGPRGMDKLIHDDKGSVTISNDGARRLRRDGGAAHVHRARRQHLANLLHHLE